MLWAIKLLLANRSLLQKETLIQYFELPFFEGWCGGRKPSSPFNSELVLGSKGSVVFFVSSSAPYFVLFTFIRYAGGFFKSGGWLVVSIHTDQLLWLLKRAFLKEGRGKGGGGGGRRGNRDPGTSFYEINDYLSRSENHLAFCAGYDIIDNGKRRSYKTDILRLTFSFLFAS